jgi:2-polyprenyl-6-methoxyphenol hydroxylase-like FAD-dependent oxidoreductase
LIDPETGRLRLEGLGERVAQLLEARGLDAALATATAMPVRRSVKWAGLTGTENGERLVQRPAFDAALRQAAIATGVQFHSTRISRILKKDPVKGVLLKLASGEEIAARVLVDARGRQAPSPLRSKGPQTLAISGWLATSNGEAGTRVEASPQGWLWVADHQDFGRFLQISIDAGDLSGSGQTALKARMDRFLRQAGLVDRYGTSTFDGPLLARNAGLVLNKKELSLPVFPVGDAAVAIDPLSGHGLFWALSSALAAVPAILTLLDGCSDGPDLAARFYRSRVVDTFWRQARTGRDFYRLEKDLAKLPFWACRASWPDNALAHPAVDSVRFERRVVVDGNRLEEREVLVTPLDPSGVAFVAGIPVAELAEFMASASGTRALPADPSPAFFTALQWLESRGLRTDPSHPSASRSCEPIGKTTIRMRETA